MARELPPANPHPIGDAQSTRLRPWLRRRCWLVGVALVALIGCNSPTLPLPPPQALVSPPENGSVLIEGSALADAWVFCINNDTEVGVATRADEAGAFQLRIDAEEGHYLSLWQQLGADTGPTVDLLVPMRR